MKKLSSFIKNIFGYLIILLLTIFALYILILKFVNSDMSLKDLKKNTLTNNFQLHEKIYQTITDYDKEVPHTVNELNLPLLRLNLSRNDVAHFYDIYEKYKLMNDYGQNYYSANNKWRKSSLQYSGVNKIKIKSHGLAPTNHSAGQYISYNIKMDDNNNIWNANRFNLIIRDRIRDKRLLVYNISKELDLIYKPIIPIRVKIINWKEKLYYFQYRLENDYLESINKSSYKIFGYSEPNDIDNKSSIYIDGDFNYIEYEKYFNKIFSKINYPGNYRAGVFNHYYGFNNDLFNNRFKNIQKYFDLDYISSYNAARTILGFMGHGFTTENFHVFLNLANGKFYPAFTQDNIPSDLKLEDGLSIEEQINEYYVYNKRLPFFSVIDQNDYLRQEKYKKIYQTINNKGEKLIQKNNKIIDNDHRLHYFGWLRLLLNKMGKSIDVNPTSNNIKVLNEYISTSKPDLKIASINNKLIFHINPESMSAINIEKLLLKDIYSIQNKLSKIIDFKFITAIGDSIINIEHSKNKIKLNNSYIELTNVVQNLMLSSSLDFNSKIIQRNYYFIFTFNDPITENINNHNIEIRFINSVTGKLVPSENVIIDYKMINIDRFDTLKYSLNENSYENWIKNNAHLKFTLKNNNDLILDSGTYTLKKDLFIPENLKLVINPGTTILLSESVSLIAFEGININGTTKKPVIITSLDSEKPFGTIGILGDGHKTKSKIDNLYLSNGSGQWINGTLFSGGLSIHYNDEILISNSKIHNNHAEDGLNIKYSNKININNCKFMENYLDQVDLDYCNGEVINSVFYNDDLLSDNGDGLDISGSRIKLTNNEFIGFVDKGLSVGEKSEALVNNNIFKNNKYGIAVKDLSNAFLLNNIFYSDSLDIDVFQKKNIYGGGSVFIYSDTLIDNSLKYKRDKFSSLNYYSDYKESELEKIMDKFDFQ